MKLKGNCSEYVQERNKELHDIFKRLYRESTSVDIRHIASQISRMPAKRFYVSPGRAAIVISSMQRGNTLEKMEPIKRDMYNVLYERVEEYKRKHYPNGGAPSVSKIVDYVLREPAPSFYLTEKTIKIILYRIINGWYTKNR